MTSSTLQKIKEILLAVFAPLHLELKDDSASHAGHAGARSGAGHYQVVIASALFEGKSLLEQHRMVKEALKGMMGKEIHALQLKTQTSPQPPPYLRRGGFPRIVSLIASSTEIICALGFENQLVGRSHECDFPASVKKLPQCTEAKFNIEGTSYEIDQRVKAILQEGLSVYRVFADKLRELKPDVIVTQVQCEVCAVSEKDVELAVCELIDTKPKIISLNTNALEDFWEDIMKVARALDAPEKGVELVERLKNRMQKITSQVGTGCAAPASGMDLSLPRPTVAFIEWIDPLMSCGNWMPTLIEMAGGINLFGEAGKHSPWMKWEELLQKNPDVIVISPCGYDIPKTREEMKTLLSKPEWSTLKAVQNQKVFLADGNQFFNRPGPRLVESLEMLAEMFHPGHFRFGHQGKGWERF